MDRIDWLIGSWVVEIPGQGRTNTESWSKSEGDDARLVGRNEIVDDASAELIFFEDLAIEYRDGRLVYLASPAGRRPPTAFTQIDNDDPDVIIFENLEHDFPQRIIYHRDGPDTLTARIEGVMDGEQTASEWQWRRK